MSGLEAKDEGNIEKAENGRRGREIHIKDLAYGVHRVGDRKEKKWLPLNSVLSHKAEIWSALWLAQTEPEETSATQFQRRSLTRDAVWAWKPARWSCFIKLLFLPDSFDLRSSVINCLTLDNLEHFLKVSKSNCFKLSPLEKFQSEIAVYWMFWVFC